MILAGSCGLACQGGSGLESFSFLNFDRFVAKSCHVAITDVRKCVMRAPVVTVPEQATGNVHVGKLVSIVYTM